MQRSQNNLQHCSCVDSLIIVQHILGLRVLLLQRWQNVGWPMRIFEDDGRGGKKAGADNGCARGPSSSSPSLSPLASSSLCQTRCSTSASSARALRQLFLLILAPAAVAGLRAGAGRNVSGRPASELTFGGVMGEEGCCGDGVGVVEVCTEMGLEVGSGLDARCLCLGGLAFGTRRSERGASTTISTSSSELSCSCSSSEESLPLATRRRFLRGLLDVCRWRFPLLARAS
jgi:hypothetical protein